MREETQAQEIELLSFRLGGEEYAVLVEDVREVLKSYHLTIVPNAPDYILGVTSLRGTMLPIIDLCKRLGLASRTSDEKSRIVVVSSADESVGLLVDRVTGVFRILPDEIKPAPENIEQGAEFLSGIVRTADRLYILLDFGKEWWECNINAEMRNSQENTEGVRTMIDQKRHHEFLFSWCCSRQSPCSVHAAIPTKNRHRLPDRSH